MDYHELIDHFGTQQQAADALGLAQPTIAMWKDRGIPVPRQYQIQVVTRGRLKANPRDAA